MKRSRVSAALSVIQSRAPVINSFGKQWQYERALDWKEIFASIQ